MSTPETKTALPAGTIWRPNRAGDNGAGLPPPGAEEIAAVAEQEYAVVLASERESLDVREFEHFMQEYLDRTTNQNAGVSTNLLWGVVLLLSAALSLFIFAQTVSLIRSLYEFPFAVQVVAWGVLGLLLLAAVWGIVRLARVYFRFRSFQSIRVQLLRELRARSATRALAQQTIVDARGRLHGLLKEYNFDSDFWSGAIRRERLDEPSRRLLIDHREKLLDGDRFANSDQWVRDCQTFQGLLDKSAESCIKSRAKMVAVKTAVSPFAAIDMLVFTYHACLMLEELCAIYNLRTDRKGTLILLSNVVGSIYLTGLADQAADSVNLYVTDELSHSNLHIWLADVFGSGGGKMIESIAGKFSAAAADGLSAYLLMRRLGNQACRLLRPLA